MAKEIIEAVKKEELAAQNREAQARSEAAALVKAAQEEAEKIRTEGIRAARQEVDALLAAAQEEAERQKNELSDDALQMLQKLDETAQANMEEAVGKILKTLRGE